MLCSDLCHHPPWLHHCAFPPIPLFSVRGCVFGVFYFPCYFSGFLLVVLFSSIGMLISCWQVLSIMAILCILVPKHTESQAAKEEEITLSFIKLHILYCRPFYLQISKPILPPTSYSILFCKSYFKSLTWRVMG